MIFRRNIFRRTKVEPVYILRDRLNEDTGMMETYEEFDYFGTVLRGIVK